MEIYIAFLQDRHCDTTAKVFAKEVAAIAWAKAEALECCRCPEDYKESSIDGWIFYAQYSCEGGCVWVVKDELKS